MRDPRLDRLAANLLDYSLELKSGQRVLIESDTSASDLLIALIEAAYQRGAVPFYHLADAPIRRAWFLGAEQAQMEVEVGWALRMIEDVDANLYITGGRNASELADVPSAVMEASRLANAPLMEKYLAKRWCLLRYPTPAGAQAAGMSTAGFEDFCLAVSTLDYARMDKAMDPLVDLMARTDRVRIVAPSTDLAFSIKGIPIQKAAGKNNIPDGEVFTAPVRDSVSGTIVFNTPSLEEGTTYERVRLTFKAGEVVDSDANEPEKLVTMLDTDEGSRYLGEFALGVNPHIDRPMKDTLYDEKIGGSLHLALGRAYDESDNGNRSSVHWDLVLIQSPQWGGGELYFDDVLVRKDGRFVLSELEGLNPENLG